MVWFKVDDTLAFHAKVVAAGNPAMGLWVRAGAWCSQQLTDGFVPSHMVTSLGTTRQARMLVTAGLWEVAEGGYSFHDWSDGERQPTREQVENKREAWREKKRRQRRNSAGKFEVSPGDNQGDSSGESRRPVPSRPVPSNSSRSTREGSVTREDEPPQLETSVPRHILPAGWVPNTAHKAYAGERGIDLGHELHQFRAHCKSKRVTSLDWDAEFDKWLGNARSPRGGGASAKRTTSDRVRTGMEIAAAFAQADGTNVVAFPQLTEGA